MAAVGDIGLKVQYKLAHVRYLDIQRRLGSLHKTPSYFWNTVIVAVNWQSISMD